MSKHLVFVVGVGIFGVLGLVGCSQQGGNKSAGAPDGGKENECKTDTKPKTPVKPTNKKNGKATKELADDDSSGTGADDSSDEDAQNARPANNRSKGKNSGSNLTDHADDSDRLDEHHESAYLDDNPTLALIEGDTPYMRNSFATATGTATGTGTKVSYESDIKQLITESCATVGCHATKAPAMGTWAEVNANRVKIVTSIKNASMPLPPAKLTAEQIDKVKAWELAGFLETSGAAGGTPPVGPGGQNPPPAGSDNTPVAGDDDEAGDGDEETPPKSPKKPANKKGSKQSDATDDDNGCATKANNEKKEISKKPAPKKKEKAKTTDDDDTEDSAGDKE